MALERLYAATAAISAVIDDEQRLFSTVPEQFASLVNARYGALGILGEDGTLKGFYTHGLSRDEEAFLRPTPPVGHGILGAMLIEGRPLRIDDMEMDPRRAGMPVGHPQMRSFLGVPLIASSRVIGRLYATEREDGTFTPADEMLAMGFAAAAAVAIESAWRTTRLVESERLRAAGELAIGIAHDFNNLLSTIIGRVEGMLATATDASVTSSLDAIRRAARDGAVIAGRMQQFGRAVDFDDFRPIDLREVAQDAIDFTRPRWHRTLDVPDVRSIQVTADLQEVAEVDGDPVSIREALVNLIFNAVDALPSGGHVTVRTRTGPYSTSVIEVADDGTGIPTSAIAHIFTPFFTTKGARGSGLGLAMVKRVIDGHRGTVEVNTTSGKGTVFTLSFPAIAVISSAKPGANKWNQRAPTVSRPTATTAISPLSIILVDDQADVLETIAILLRLDGHEVRSFTAGRDALESANVRKPDVLITDLSMAPMSGWDVARAFKRDAPGTPVIMLTGLGREITLEEASANGVSLVISKPPDRETLRRALVAAVSTAELQVPVQVLIVDDSAGFRAAMSLLLKAQGHEVTEADGVQMAIELINGTRKIELALIDAHLPDGDSNVVVDALRTADPATAIWAMSGSDVDTIQKRVIGADVYIEKLDLPSRIGEVGSLSRRRAVP
jgi:signal transduction histidine kinase/CheY-like chemotaxis protein